MEHPSYHPTHILCKILFFLLCGSLFTVLLFPLFFGKAFFLTAPFVNAELFNILIELSLIVYLVLVRYDSTYRPFFTTIHILITALAFSLLISTLFGIDPVLGFWGSGKRGDGMFFILHTVLFFYLITWVVKSSREWFALLACAVGIGFLAGLAAVIAKLFFPNHSFTEAGHDLLFGNPSALAHVVVLIIPPAGYFLCIRFSRWLRSKKRFSIKGTLPWLLYLATILLLMYSGYISDSFIARVALVALIGFFLLALALYHKKAIPLLLGYGLLGVIYALVKQIGFSAIQAVIVHSLDSLVYRIHIWKMILKAFAARPLFGYGWFNLRFIYDDFYDPWLNYIPNAHVDKAHNIFFEHLITGGIVAVLIVLILWGYIIYLLSKHVFLHIRKKITATETLVIFNGEVRRDHLYILFLFIFLTHLFFLQFNLMFVSAYIIISLFLALATLALPVKKILQPTSGQLRIVSIIGIPLLMISIFAFNVQPLYVNYRINKLLSYLPLSGFVRNPTTTIQEARKMRQQRMYYFEHRDTLAFIFSELGTRPDISPEIKKEMYIAVKQVHEEILRDHPRISVNYAKLFFNELYLGNLFNPSFRKDAEQYLQKAISFNRKQGAYLFQLSKFYLNTGRKDKGCPILEELTEGTYPKAADFYWGLCAAQDGAFDTASNRIIGSLSEGPRQADYWRKEGFRPKSADFIEMETIYEKINGAAQLIVLYQDMIKKLPKEFTLQRQLIRYYSTHKMKQEAEDQARKTIEAFPDKEAVIAAILKAQTTEGNDDK